VLGEIRKLLPFPLLGLDTDNDSVFMNETVRDYCEQVGIEFTRCRPYRKKRPSSGSGRARHRIITTSGLFTDTGTEGQGASPGALITRNQINLRNLIQIKGRSAEGSVQNSISRFQAQGVGSTS
jgi:hypothetical protein